MKKIFIINGSPRKNWNTAKMCKSFSDGANSKGIETEIINLYDFNFSGCRSCFACKLKEGKNFGRCAYPDELTPVLDKIAQADGLVLATPIYNMNISGMMKCFLERLTFPYFEYKEGYPSIAPKKFETAVIYTMNISEEVSNQMLLNMYELFEWNIATAFTNPIRICAYDTCQFSDYSKYVNEIYDPEHKRQQFEEQLPKDIKKAFIAGAKMAERVINENQF